MAGGTGRERPRGNVRGRHRGDTRPAGCPGIPGHADAGLLEFDIGAIPASVTPPHSWRRAAWFAVGSSAAVVVGLAYAASVLVTGPRTGHTIEALPGLPHRPLVTAPVTPPTRVTRASKNRRAVPSAGPGTDDRPPSTSVPGAAATEVSDAATSPGDGAPDDHGQDVVLLAAEEASSSPTTSPAAVVPLTPLSSPGSTARPTGSAGSTGSATAGTVTGVLAGVLTVVQSATGAAGITGGTGAPPRPRMVLTSGNLVGGRMGR